MKNAFLFVILIVAVSCQNPDNINSTTTLNEVSISAESLDSIEILFGGNWVNKKYVDKLLLTKSPRASQEIADITMVVFPDYTGQFVGIDWNFHEGWGGILNPSGAQYGIFNLDTKELSYSVTFDGGVITLNGDEFIQVIETADQRDHDISEQLLFAGKYIGEGGEVEFTNNGEIKGIDSLSFYSVFADYIDAGMQVDQLIMGSGPEDNQTYGFQFHADTLLIYHLNCLQKEDEYCVVVENGEVVLSLIKM